MLAVTLQGLATTTGGWRCSRPTGGSAADQTSERPCQWFFCFFMSFLERFLEASTGSPPDRQLKRRRRFWLGCGLAAAFQSRFVLRVVVLPAVLPAAEGNAHPFVCQRPYGRMVRFVFVVALRAVIGLCPVTVENGLASPLMERLPQKFWGSSSANAPSVAGRWLRSPGRSPCTAGSRRRSHSGPVACQRQRSDGGPAHPRRLAGN